MDPATPTLDAAVLIDRLARNELPRDFLLMAAQGFLPFPQDELIAVLSHLSVYTDPEIVQVARKSLQDLPTRVVITFARAENVAPDHLDALSKATEDPAVLEAILRNRATGDATIVDLASHVSPSLQEVIVINQERILRTPGILDALLSNAEISPDVYRRVVETREEFFEKRDRAAERAALLAEYELNEAEKAEFADLLAEAEKLDKMGVENTLPDKPPSTDAEHVSAWSLIFHMTISQKVQVALKGTRTQRSILIRERNKLVVAAVVRSPRMTEPEAEAFAGMRNIDDEALRIIGLNRHWMSKYPIMAALVKNPKTPVGVVLPLINRLTLRDLKGLQGDKGVSEAVRQQARKLYQTRRVTQ
jgi:hypothetical protein